MLLTNPLSVNASLFPQSSIRDPQSAIRNASHQSEMLFTNPLSVNASLFPRSAISNPQCFSPIRYQ